MNSLFNRLKYFFTYGSKMKRMMLSIVILAEVIVLLVVATYAWVETVSSIKITNETNTKGEIDTYVFTEAMIGAEQGTIDIAKYFKQSGDMHLAPASSADGTTMFFPKANLSSDFIYRKGNVSDKNTAYLSVSFKVRTDTNADFFFDKGTNDQGPSFSALEDDIRVSVTSQSEGSTSAPVTTIYSKNASTTAVVNSTSGGTGATTVAAYSDHIKGTGSANRLFAVGANETKIITINIWLQKNPNADTDLTNNMSQAVTITNFGITSSLTRTLTIYRTVDGSTSSTAAAGTITIGGTTSSNTATSYSKTVDKGSSVSFSATAAAGYKFDGFYTTATGTTKVESPLTIDNNTTYYARFSAKSYNIKTRPYYTNNVGGTSYDLGNTGGTVKTGDATATSGSTTISSKSVKFNSSVTLKATPLSGYVFVGWYTAGSSGGTLLSSNAEYTYTLDSADTLDANDGATVYGRFMKTNTTSIYVTPRADWGNDYYIRLYQGSGNNVIDSNNGFVQATYDSNTGYYKANFTTTKTGTFYAILAKDTNHTDKVPSEGGYTGTLGTSYVFKHNQSDSELTEYDSQRCIWFIDGTTNHFIGDNNAKMRIDNWSDTYDMRSIGNYCYIYEYTTGTDFSNASGITFKRTNSSNEEWNYWNTSPTSGKSQYTATGTGSNHGSWTN